MTNTVVMTHIRKSFLLLLMASTLAACKAENNYFATANASVGGVGSGGAVDATTGFKVSIVPKTGVEGFIHKFGSTAACEIALASKDTPTDIKCMLNMMEYDVFFYGFETELNVPAGFCSFIEEVPYRYYKSRPGVGPASMVVNTTDGLITTCTIDGVAGTVTNNNCVGPEATITASGAVTCAYDYQSPTDSSGAGPNCCVGRGTVALNANNTVSGTASQTTTQVNYSSSLWGCTESPYDYISTWPKLSNGKAGTAVEELGAAGRSRKTKIPSVLALLTAGQRPATAAVYLNANMYDWSSYSASPTTWAATSTKPRAIAPLVDKGPTGDNVTNASTIPALSDGDYQFRCLGPAGELRHRISVYVNAWNTIEDFTAFKANGVPSAVNPNRTGTAGVDCAAVSSSITCNSFWGFDDMILNASRGNGVKNAFVFPDEQIWGTPP